MRGAEVQTIARRHKDFPIKINPVTIVPVESKIREKSYSIEDAAYGDSGKGAVTRRLIHRAQRNAKTIRLSTGRRINTVNIRGNGASNTGHEVPTGEKGKSTILHQLNVGVLEEGVTPISTRGQILHPHDWIAERDRVTEEMGGRLPSQPLLDSRIPLCLDTHRALERAIKSVTTSGDGSTNTGNAFALGALYEKNAVTLHDLAADNWKETFSRHWDLYDKLTRGFGEEFQLTNAVVRSLSEGSKRIGSREDFLKELRRDRAELKPYIVEDMNDLLEEIWHRTDAPVVIEMAQGAGLDPMHGIYPDVTASRPITRFLTDPTYGVIEPDDIAIRLGVMKTIYISSVGTRQLPEPLDEELAKRAALIREENDEYGRTTRRKRGVHSVSIPLLRSYKKVAGYRHLALTHLDSARVGRTIPVIGSMVDKYTGEERDYQPYQDELNELKPGTVEYFDEWDGEKVNQDKVLPEAAVIFAGVLSETVAPIAYGTTGREMDDYISWLPDGY